MTTTIAPEAHEHVIHLKVSWETYETLVADSGENRRALLSYDGETLELMAPNADHEAHKTLVEALLAILVLEWDFNLYEVRRVDNVPDKTRRRGARHELLRR